MKINRQEVYVKCGGRCGYCGSIIAMKDMQVDHMTPRCNGGTNDLLTFFLRADSATITKGVQMLNGSGGQC